MKPITRRELDWIDDAPVRVTCTRRIAQPPAVVWAAIADHASWPEWFDALTLVEPGEPPTGVGGRRRVHLGRIAVEEEFLAWDEERRFAFVVTDASVRAIRSMVEDLRLEPVGDQATEVSYTQAIDPAGAKLVAPVLRRAVPRTLDKGLAGLARHVRG